MHQIDPMQREWATAGLVNFHHPLLEPEKKNLSYGKSTEEKNFPTMAGISKKLILRPGKLPPDIALLDSFPCTSDRTNRLLAKLYPFFVQHSTRWKLTIWEDTLEVDESKNEFELKREGNLWRRTQNEDDLKNYEYLNN